MDRTESLDQLRQGIAQLTSTEAWQRWLRVQRRLYRYSAGNAILIHCQFPEATHVAGFRTWLQLGRHVRKGEKGIAILAPIVRRVRVQDGETGDDTIVVSSPSAFRVTHVFDVTQTDGEELQAAPVATLEGDDPDALYPRLRSVAAAIGYTVEEDYLDGQNGECTPGDRRIRIDVRNQPAQQLKTLVHELAHAILHDGPTGLPRERKELEAESVAYIVCAGLGLDSSAYSFGYVATWMGGGEEAQRAISESAQRIQRAARRILDGGIDRDPVEAA